MRGRRLLRSDGKPWVWQGLTAFRLCEMIHAGRRDEVEAYCAWAAANGVTLLRVFTMAGAHAGEHKTSGTCPGCSTPYLFRLDPADGRRALPEVLSIAGSHGLYCECVCLVDTAFWEFNHQHHVFEIGQIAAAHDGAFIQIANEPAHVTQLGRIADPDNLAMLRRTVPSDVPTTLGPAHGSDDHNFTWAGGDFATVHFDRSNGEDHFTHDGAGLRWVRHIKDGLDTSQTLSKYVVNDEPRRNDFTPWKHTAVGILCRMLGLGDTFHYGGGMHGQIPEGSELAAFAGRQRGWQAIPVEWDGSFRNAATANSPVTAADWSTVLKVFCSVQSDMAYVLAIGGPDPQFTWANDWPHRELVLQEGGTSLYQARQ